MATAGGAFSFSRMSTVMEIEAALKRLPLQNAQAVAHWLQAHLEAQRRTNHSLAAPSPVRLPDYASRRQSIMGEKVLPNMVMVGRAQERW